mgnify:CR=1 FL=1
MNMNMNMKNYLRINLITKIQVNLTLSICTPIEIFDINRIFTMLIVSNLKK